jgi:hypothetical protein
MRKILLLGVAALSLSACQTLSNAITTAGTEFAAVNTTVETDVSKACSRYEAALPGINSAVAIAGKVGSLVPAASTAVGYATAAAPVIEADLSALCANQAAADASSAQWVESNLADLQQIVQSLTK